MDPKYEAPKIPLWPRLERPSFKVLDSKDIRFASIALLGGQDDHDLRVVMIPAKKTPIYAVRNWISAKLLYLALRISAPAKIKYVQRREQ